MNQRESDLNLRRLLDVFDRLPECLLKSTMRGMLRGLSEVLHRDDDAAFTIERLHEAEPPLACGVIHPAD